MQQRYRGQFKNVNISILRSMPGQEGALIDLNPAGVKTLEADNREQLLAHHPREIYIDFPVKDNVDRKQAEKKLKESEEKFRVIFENNSAAIAVIELDTTISMVNDAYCEMCGYTRQEVIGTSWTQQIPPDDLERLKEYYRRALSNPKDAPDKFDFKFYRKDGELRCGLMSVSFIHTIRKIIASFVDITDREKVEEALQHKEAVLRSMFHATPAGVALLVHHKLTKVNRALCLLFGYSEEELLNQNIHILYPDEKDFKRMEEELYDSIMRKGLGTMETQLRRKDGVLINVLLNLSPFNLSSPDEGLTATVLDITDRKRAEETVKTSLEQMRLLASKIESTREEERKSISREVHDELGQVLTGIRMELEEIERVVPVKNDLFLLKINRTFNLLDEAITTVQDISARLRPGILDDLGLFAAVEWQTDEFQKMSGITCTLELPEMDSSLDEMRSTALFRIFQETLTNVARHAHAKNVDIKLLETNDAFTLTVRDNGIGITENHLKDPRSLGLIGIQERLRPFHGTCTIKVMQDSGTEVQVYLPKKMPI
jgi:PAS domain S-box-containing protein